MNTALLSEAPLPRARVLAAVCTRNRGESLVPTLQTILANTHPNFALLVIDQSTNDATEIAVAPFRTDPRLIYRRTHTVGQGLSRNIALQYATEIGAEIVAYTDDDCTVPPDWLTRIETAFADKPQVAVVFCNVVAVPYDKTQGFIPAYVRHEDGLVTSLRDKCRARGMGAGLAVRVADVLKLGGFDDLLGPGAQFPSCDDGDMAVRALLAGHHVFETSAVAVEHFGFRSWAQGRDLSRRDWLAIGAAYTKPLRAGHWSFLRVFLYELLVRALWPPLKEILLLRKPQGITRVTAFLRGVRQSLQVPIDTKTLRFQPANGGDSRVLRGTTKR
jgi:glycosyltransferase involved in cell wall biosynthesis